jgi:hypothetical protein
MLSEFIINVIYPNTKQEVTVFYLFWTVLYLFAHLVWDFIENGGFDLYILRHKVTVMFSATGFSTSLLLILSLTNDNLFRIVGETTIPLIIAGFSGILIALSELKPSPRGRQPPSTP